MTQHQEQPDNSDEALEHIESLIKIYGQLPTGANLRRIMSLIKADREAYATSRVVEELETLKAKHSRTYKQTVTDNEGNVYMNESHSYISSYETQERIATLKASQEEKKDE